MRALQAASVLVLLLGATRCDDRPERTALRIQPLDAGSAPPACAIPTTPSCGDPCADGVVMDGDARMLAENADVKEFYLGIAEGRRRSFRDSKHYRRRKRWLA